MSLVRVIGIGSPFGDDRLGWRVIELLKTNAALRPFLNKSIDLLQSDRPGLSLLNSMQNVDMLFIIDAIKSNSQPAGYIHHLDSAGMMDTSGFLSTHGFGVASALSLANAMNALPDQTRIYGIEMTEVMSAESLSQEVEAACQRLSLQLSTELLALVNS